MEKNEHEYIVGQAKSHLQKDVFLYSNAKQVSSEKVRLHNILSAQYFEGYIEKETAHQGRVGKRYPHQ